MDIKTIEQNIEVLHKRIALDTANLKSFKEVLRQRQGAELLNVEIPRRLLELLYIILGRNQSVLTAIHERYPDDVCFETLSSSLDNSDTYADYVLVSNILGRES